MCVLVSFFAAFQTAQRPGLLKKKENTKTLRGTDDKSKRESNTSSNQVHLKNEMKQDFTHTY